MKHELSQLDLTHLTYAEFSEFITRTVTDYGTVPAPALPFDAAIPNNYIRSLTEQQSLFDRAILRIQANADTHVVVLGDEVRDRALSAFFKAVDLGHSSDDAAEIEASRRLAIVAKAYQGIARLNYESETKVIDKMLEELQGPVYSPSVAQLNLQRYVTRIRTANDDFKGLFAGRLTTEALTESFDTNNLRLALLDRYREYALYLQAMANATDHPFYVQQLSLNNAARKYFSDLLARRRGTAAAREDAAQKD